MGGVGGDMSGRARNGMGICIGSDICMGIDMGIGICMGIGMGIG